MNKFISLSLIILLNPILLFSQNNSSTGDTTKYYFQKILQSSTENTFTRSERFSHCSYDSSGRLWLGNKSQISVYDGNKVLSLEIPLNGNINFQVAKGSWVWYATDSFELVGLHNGLRYLNKLPIQSDLDRIVDIRMSSDSKAIVSLYSGRVYTYDLESQSLKLINHSQLRNLYSVEQLPSSNSDPELIWSTDQGIYKAILNDSINLNKIEFNLSDIICTDIEVQDSIIYIGSESGFIQKFSLNDDKPKWTRKVSNYSIEEIHIQDKEMYAISSDNAMHVLACANGNSRYSGLDNDKWKDFDFFNEVQSVLINEKGALKLYNTGIEKMALSIGVIQSIDYFKDSIILVGSDKGAFLAKNFGGYITEIEKIHSGNVISVEVDNNSNRWIGTFGDGLYRYDKHNKLIQYYNTESGLPDNSILSMDSDSSSLWLGTLGGLGKINSDDNSVKTIELDIGAQYIYHIEKSHNRLYFSTDGRNMGYVEVDDSDGYRTEFFDKKRTVYTFDLIDDKSVLYPELKTGLIKYDDHGKSVLISDSILNVQNIGSLIYQDSLTIMISQEGIILYNLKNKDLIYLNQSGECNLANHTLNASTQLYSEYRYVASGNCILRLNPRTLSLFKNIIVSPLYLKVNNQVVSYTEKSNFKYWQTALSFGYVGLFSRNRNIRYQYKIEGIQNRWNQTSDNLISFSQIPPGDYTFKIRAMDDDGIYNSSLWTYDFTIEKPWWWKWWFITIISLTFISIIYFYFKWRERNKLRYARLKQDKIQAQLDAIRSQINPHFLFNSFNSLLSLIEINPKRAARFTENLSDFYRKLLQLNPSETIPYSEEIKISKQYISLMKVRYPESVEIDEEVDDKEFHLIPFTIQILVENAIKHNTISTTNTLSIKIYDDEDFLYIQNNISPKFTIEEGEGFGLESINERYLYKTERGIDVNHTNTYFKVSIPKILTDEDSNS